MLTTSLQLIIALILGSLIRARLNDALHVLRSLTQMCTVRCKLQNVGYYAPAPVRKGTISAAFVRPAVAYIANNSRTQRPSVPEFGRKVPHLRCDSHTSIKVTRLKVRVTRPINANTHRAPYLPMVRPTNFKLGIRNTDGGRQLASATGDMTYLVVDPVPLLPLLLRGQRSRS